MYDGRDKPEHRREVPPGPPGSSSLPPQPPSHQPQFPAKVGGNVSDRYKLTGPTYVSSGPRRGGGGGGGGEEQLQWERIRDDGLKPPAGSVKWVETTDGLKRVETTDGGGNHGGALHALLTRSLACERWTEATDRSVKSSPNAPALEDVIVARLRRVRVG